MNGRGRGEERGGMYGLMLDSWSSGLVSVIAVTLPSTSREEKYSSNTRLTRDAGLVYKPLHGIQRARRLPTHVRSCL